jgi:hypothetical protein
VRPVNHDFIVVTPSQGGSSMKELRNVPS